MNGETKRLLKCDMLYIFKNAWIFILTMSGIQLWFYSVYKMMANTAILVCFVTCIMLLNCRIQDWQSQIRMYVSAGMSRKGVFRVLFIRNVAITLSGMMIEAVLSFAYYPEILVKILALSGFFQLFVWGLGEIAGVLIYQGKKRGRILMVIGYAMVSILLSTSFWGEMRSGFWMEIVAGITAANLLVIGVVVAAVLAGGICLAKKRIGEYMVY